MGPEEQSNGRGATTPPRKLTVDEQARSVNLRQAIFDQETNKDAWRDVVKAMSRKIQWGVISSLPDLSRPEKIAIQKWAAQLAEELTQQYLEAKL